MKETFEVKMHVICEFVITDGDNAGVNFADLTRKRNFLLQSKIKIRKM